jgi:hypothetical protein
MRAALAAAMLGILLAGMPAAAAAELGAAGLRVTPFLTERVEYESNILQSASNAQDDAIVRTVPGVLLELPMGSHRLDLGARVEVLNFVDLPRYNAEHVFLLGTLALRFPSSLVMTVKEDFAYTTEPPGTELTGRVRSTTSVLAPSVEYDVGRRVALGADYTWTRVDFERAFAQLDRDEHTGGLSAFYRVALKTDLFANVAYGVKEFRSAPIRDVDRYRRGRHPRRADRHGDHDVPRRCRGAGAALRPPHRVPRDGRQRRLGLPGGPAHAGHARGRVLRRGVGVWDEFLVPGELPDGGGRALGDAHPQASAAACTSAPTSTRTGP